MNTKLDEKIEELIARTEATNFNLLQLQRTLYLIRDSLKYSQKKFVEEVNKICPNILSLSGLAKIEKKTYVISMHIGKAIFEFLSGIIPENIEKKIQFVNIMNIFVYDRGFLIGKTFNQEEQMLYADFVISSPKINEEILYKNMTKDADKILIGLKKYASWNLQIDNIILIDIRTALSKNLKSIRMICRTTSKEFSTLLNIPYETYKDYDNNKLKLSYDLCKQVLLLLKNNYSENKDLPEIISLITSTCYSRTEVSKIIDSNIRNYALSINLPQDIRDKVYEDYINKLSKTINLHKGDIEYLLTLKTEKASDSLSSDDFKQLKDVILYFTHNFKLSQKQKEELTTIIHG